MVIKQPARVAYASAAWLLLTSAEVICQGPLHRAAPADVSCMAKDVEEKLAFPKQQTRLHELAQRKSRLLTVQNGSRRGTDVSRAVILHEGSLRTLWADKAKRHVEAKQVWRL